MKSKLAKSLELKEGGLAIRFMVQREGHVLPAIAVRFEGEVHAYINQCAHLGLELDVRPGQVFSRSGNTLICAAHGAEYHARDGSCAAGPCFGDPLMRITVIEEDGKVFVDDPICTISRYPADS